MSCYDVRNKIENLKYENKKEPTGRPFLCSLWIKNFMTKIYILEKKLDLIHFQIQSIS